LDAVRLRAMTDAIDWTEFRNLAHLPEITLDVYQRMPEEISKRIEVVDGWLVRCESPEPTHQVIARNFANLLWAAVKEADRARGACHRVANDVDVLIADVPRLHFRCPDVSVYRCVNEERSRWGRKPYASDCLVVLEIVSADSVTTDLRDKRAEYAAAGIPHYWVVRMTASDGPAISVERFLLSADGVYVSLGIAVRGRDFNAVDVADPLRVVITWEQLDEGL
jgi:Uma2 family endonuclease